MARDTREKPSRSRPTSIASSALADADAGDLLPGWIAERFPLVRRIPTRVTSLRADGTSRERSGRLLRPTSDWQAVLEA
jgi:hypothetical protein